jgi:hypothetical protein
LTPSAEQAAAAETVARFVVRTGLVVPAILALESLRPLSFVGSQFMHVLSPSVTAMLPAGSWDALATLLEDRRGLDYLLARIESLDEARRA